MNVFVSWSVDESKIIAEALNRWLPDVFPGLHVFMSGHGIKAGASWDRELGGS